MQRAVMWLSAISMMAACGGPEDDPLVIEPAPIAAPDAPPPGADAPRPDEAPPPVETPDPLVEPDAPRAQDAITRHIPIRTLEPIVHLPPVDARRPILRPLTQSPVMGGTLWVAPGGDVAVATDPGHDRVYFVDLDAQRIRAHHILRGAEPWRIIEHAGEIWITLRRAGQVARFDLASWALIDRHPVCGAPRGLAYDHRADVIRVACAGGELVSLDPMDGAEVERFQLDPDLRDVVVTPDHLLVSTFRTPQLLVVRNGRVADIWAPRPQYDEDALVATPSVAWRTIEGPRGTVIMMHQRSSVEEVRLSGRTGYAGGRRGECPTGMVQAVATQFLPDGFVRAEAVIAESALPVDVASRGDGELMVADGILANQARRFPTIFGVFTPTADGVVGCPTSEDRFVLEPQQGGTLAVGFDDHDGRYVLAAAPLRLMRLQPSGEMHEIMLPTGQDDAGRATFHTLAPAQIACASCHPEGSDDGHVWHFERLGDRRTQHLRGGLAGTEPFHWDGEFADMNALIGEVMGNRMGMAVNFNHGGGADVLAWLDGLPATRVAAVVADRDVVEHGAQVYGDPSVGCTGCHAMDGSPAITGSVDVGTGGLFQVPTLKGVAGRPPYLHDGCAPTLEDRFSHCGGGERHGQTAHLSAVEMTDLIAFLRTL